MDLKYSQEVICYPHNTHATIALMGTFCLSGQFCSLQDVLIGKTIDDFSFPVSCITLVQNDQT